MSIFDSLGRLYLEIDREYANNEVKARLRKHIKIEKSISVNRQLNDHAYFLFMFSRLEDRVKVLSDKLIEKRIQNNNWNNRKVWEIIKTNKLNFINRVSLLTVKGGKDYNLIKYYYEQRNIIAHGGNFSVPIFMPTVINDMKKLYKAFKK